MISGKEGNSSLDLPAIWNTDFSQRMVIWKLSSHSKVISLSLTKTLGIPSSSNLLWIYSDISKVNNIYRLSTMCNLGLSEKEIEEDFEKIKLKPLPVHQL